MTVGRDHHTAPFRPGEPVLLIDQGDRRYTFTLAPGKVYQVHRGGPLPHDAIIGQPEGTTLWTDHGHAVTCLRPDFEGRLLKWRRKTQILYPKDLGLVLLRGNVYPGARVLEAGMGSGALAAVLLRFLGPEGHLISYERRPDIADLAEGNLARQRELYGDSGARHTIEVRDVYEGIEATELDLIVLDLPEPWRCLAAAAAALRPGGSLLAWLPTTLQVYELARSLQEDAQFRALDSSETLLRPWHIREGSMRPAHRMVAHTGFLVSARRLFAPAEREPEARVEQRED